MRISVVLAFGALLGFPIATAAQETAPVLQPMPDSVQAAAAGCLCVLPTEAGLRVAAVQDVQGQVLLSDAVGYTPIQSNAELSVGDRIVLLNDGRAVLIAGQACRVALTPNSMISIIPTDAGICVAQASTAPGTPPVGAQLVGSQIPGLIVSSGLIATGVIGAISSGDDAQVPVSP